MSGAGGPSNFLGTRVMLTSLTEIRYSGTLHEIREPPYGSCITLANVISYGSEGRKGGGADEIPGSDQIFQLITFSTTDIKALDVIEQAPQLPDPYPNYQQHYNPYMMAPDPMWQQQPHQPQMWAQQQHFNNFPQHPNQESPKFQQQMPQKSPIQQPEPPKSKTPQPPTPSKKISSPKPPVSSIDMPKQVEKVQQEPAQPAIQSKPPKAEKRVVENTNGTTKITRQTASGTTIRYSVSSSADPSLANLSKPNPQPHPQTKQVISDQESQFRPISSNYRGNNSRGGGRGRARGNFSNHVANKVKVPESDFDFQESNAKFSKEQPETGADSDDEGQKFYQKSCFFDDISCEAKERAENDGIDRNERRARQNEERRINVETFGVAQSHNSYRGGRGGRGRGRGGAKQFLNRNATGIPSNDNRPEPRRQ